MELGHKTVYLLRAAKEAYVRGTCENVQNHLLSGDFHPAYRGISKLSASKSVLQHAAVRAEGGALLTKESEVKVHGTG